MLKRYLMFLSIALVVGCCAPRAQSAFELQVATGVFGWNYAYAVQSGSQGFFGEFNMDASSTGGNFAPSNAWLSSGLSSGSNAAGSLMYTVLIPSLRLNKAVALSGQYQLGPGYRTATAPGAGAAFADGEWYTWSIQANTPMGRISYGKRSFGKGVGLQFYGGSRSEELLLIEVDRSLSVTYGDYLFTETGLTSEEFNDLTDEEKKETADWEAPTLEVYQGWADRSDTKDDLVRLTFGLGFYPWRQGSTAYWNQEDLNSARTSNLLAYVTYTSEFLKTGMGGFYTSFHEGPESQQTVAARASFPSTDTDITEGWIFVSYGAGRFTLKSEVDWYYRTIKYKRSLDGTFNGTPDNTDGSGSLFAPDYVESWRYTVELGVLFGPTRVRFMHTRMPGPDRRHGVRIDRQPFIQEGDQRGTGAFSSYNMMVGSQYSGGLNAFGDIPDASVFALRIDYLLAANLDVSVGLLHARRISHGYGWGYIRPDATTFGSVDFAVRGSYVDPSPAIPDNDLGWEFFTAIKWDLLQNWRLVVKCGYWKPGRWFNYACVDKAVPNWDVPSSGNHFGANPDREIDPVLGLSLTLESEF